VSEGAPARRAAPTSAATEPATDQAIGALRPFDCLWCGRTWQPRGADDLATLARLCPDCLGRADSNPFIRFRLHAALEARAAIAGAESSGAATAGAATAGGATAGVSAIPTHEDELVPYYEARAAEYDDWYLRRGRYAHGPVQDLAWQMELDRATTWLDRLPLRGEIVELAAGTGWWTALLATKGELHAYDAAPAPLDLARARLVAHGLRAHLHVRDAWAPPDRPVDSLFAGFWLSHVPRARLATFLALALRWLRPGGTLALVDSLDDPASGTRERAEAPAPDLALRRLADGRTFTIPKVIYQPDDVAAVMRSLGFGHVETTRTGRFFFLVSGQAGPLE
jgi:demethylmenaquinone methyltransferase/2-methoxy-6-polyprenyl-1,4-benzoquinol methylase